MGDPKGIYWDYILCFEFLKSKNELFAVNRVPEPFPQLSILRGSLAHQRMENLTSLTPGGNVGHWNSPEFGIGKPKDQSLISNGSY